MTINIRRATPTANAGRYYIEQVEAEMTNLERNYRVFQESSRADERLIIALSAMLVFTNVAWLVYNLLSH